MRGAAGREWSHSELQTTDLKRALEELKTFPRPRESWVELEAQVHLTMRLRKALAAASWSKPKTWSGVAEELDRLQGDIGALGLSEVKAAFDELGEMRAHLERAVIDAMHAHPTCRGAQLQGCRAVATIAAGSDALEERAKAEGALRAAVCCLQAAKWSKWHNE